MQQCIVRCQLLLLELLLLEHLELCEGLHGSIWYTPAWCNAVGEWVVSGWW